GARRAPRPSEDGAPGPPSQLPPDTPDFTGRADEVAALGAQLMAARTVAPFVGVVSGRGGVGKTALAVRAAHQASAWFADGQLFANLRGAGPVPREPAEVLASFLHALGVDGGAIPDGLDARAELYRARLAGRRFLVVLDNASGEREVRPLLPGSPTCAVLVTSRARLPGLAPTLRIELGLLAPEEAVSLLGRVAGEDRAAEEPSAAREIVRLCDHLPLAVRIAGARLLARPHWRLDRLADRLRDERHRLDELVQGDLEVRASIELSYRGLPELERWALRRLALLELPDFAAWVAAPLLDLAPAVAEELVERLRDAQLLETAGADGAGQLRFRFHDLLRLYAGERAEAEEAPAERAAAVRRALDAWRSRAAAAEGRLLGGGDPADGGGPAAALAWFDAERQALAACVEQACAAGLEEIACGLAEPLATYHNVRGHYDEWRRAHELVLAAARRAGNRRAEGSMLRGLGDLHAVQDRYDEALACLRQALPLLREAGDRPAMAAVLGGTGFVLRLRSCYQEALARFQETLAIADELSDPLLRVRALLGIGSVHVDERRLDQGLACYDSALAAARDAGYRLGEAHAFRGLGVVHREAGRLDAAQAALERALALNREIGHRPGEMHVLLQLGELRRDQGRTAVARAILERCLASYRDYGDRFNESLALRALGEVALAEGRPREAGADLLVAARIAGRLRLPFWQARALRGLGEAYEADGRAEAAAAARSRAAVLCEEVAAARARGGGSG
ncbi:MAG TPA: tetratricopeptide repeat protein, partial [Candidatus Dormibacteraeota bacterium]